MEEVIKNMAIAVGLGIEALSALIIAVAVIKAMYAWSVRLTKNQTGASNESIRVRLGSSIAVSLELLLGADILQTAVAPTWNDLGQLAAIAALRTGLNYFLGKELKEIKESAVSSGD
jgi:uncharacterized membrane protein